MANLTSPIQGLSPEAYARARDYQMFLMQEFALTPEQASGYVGNLMVESDKFNIWNPGARTDPTSPQTIENAYWGTQYGYNQGAKNSGIGDAQYTNAPRHNAFIDYVNKHRMLSDWTKHASDFELNAGFMKQQLENEEKKNLYAVRQTSNPENAAKAALGYFRPSGYERGAENALHYDKRLDWSRKLYDALPNQFNDWGGWKSQDRYVKAPYLNQGGFGDPTHPTYDYNITASPNDPDPFGVGRIVPRPYGSDPLVQDLGPQLVSLSQQNPNIQYNTGTSSMGDPLIYWVDPQTSSYHTIPWAKPNYTQADTIAGTEMGPGTSWDYATPQTQRDQFGQPMGGSGSTLYSPTAELGGGMTYGDAAAAQASYAGGQGALANAQLQFSYDAPINTNPQIQTTTFQPQTVQGYTFQPQVAVTNYGTNMDYSYLNPQNNPGPIYL